jgi:hypothetical protein
VTRKRRRRWIAGRAFVYADANMEMRRAKSDRQIAVARPDMGRWRWCLELVGRALDDWSKSDFAPVILEKIAEQSFERMAEPSTSIMRLGRWALDSEASSRITKNRLSRMRPSGR